MSIHDRFNPEQEWLQQGQTPRKKPTAKTEAEYYTSKAKPDEQWTKSFHATTTAGVINLNLTRYQDGTLQGTYQLQGRKPKNLTGTIDENQGQANAYLKDNETGAKWYGRFEGDQGERILFGNVMLPGNMGISGRMDLGDVVFDMLEAPETTDSSQAENINEASLEAPHIYSPPQVKNPPPPAVKNPPPPAVKNPPPPALKGPQPTMVSTRARSTQQQNPTEVVPTAPQNLSPSNQEKSQILEPETQLEQELEQTSSLETWQKNSSKKSWREMGKLRGNPPVRSQTEPPNKNIVEDEKTYKQLLASVKALVKEQEARAETFKSKDGVVNDYRYWFMKVYSFVTENEIKYAEENTYYYPSAVLMDVLYFDKVYKDNLNASADKQEDHWKAAFATALQQQKGQGTIPLNVAKVVLSLVAGMLAHIRFDLPRSLAWVAKDYNEKYGARMDDLQPDFFSMAGVFDNATRDMVPVIIEELGRMGYNLDAGMVKVMQQGNWMNLAMREGLNADMSTERLEAWERAVALSNGDLPKDPYELKNGKLEGNVTKGENDAVLKTMQPEALRPQDAEIKADTAGVIARGLQGVARMGVTDQFLDMNSAAFKMLAYPDHLLKDTPVEFKAREILFFIRGSRDLTGFPAIYIEKLLSLANETGQLVLLMDMVGAYDLLELIDDELGNKIRHLFARNYYPKTSLNTAVSQIIKWTEKGNAKAIKVQIQTLFESRDAKERKLITSKLLSDYGIKIGNYLEK
jgi:Family of unknown function (DUF5995)